MIHHDYPYLDMLRHIMLLGVDSEDRTGTGTKKVWVYTLRFDLQKGFPLLTTKKLHWKSIVYELLFFLNGLTNRKWLNDHGVRIWNEWGDSNGNLGPMYSHQWRNFGGKYPNIPQPKPSPNGYEPTVFGAGSKGSFTTGSETENKLFVIWKGILSRCYNKSKDNYEYYGGKGVYVDDWWLVFDNFLHDVQQLEGWDKKQESWEDYQLDKDIIGDGFCYGPEYTVWASRTENRRARYRYQYHLRHEDGSEIVVHSPKDFYTTHRISQGNFCSMLRGERNKAGGWSLVETIDLWKGVDQLQKSLNLLKTNPNSRQNIVSAWNPGETHRMGLPPCHLLFQWQVMKGRLNCALYQRSCDSFLGVPFNIASYALLTHIMAAMAGLEVGEFVWIGGDVHIYNNHFEQVKEQLSRQPRESPILELPNRYIVRDYRTTFEDWGFDDFTLIDYNPLPSIKAKVSV